MWNKVHKQNFVAPSTGPKNSTTIDAMVPILMTPTSPIMEYHVKVKNREGSSIVTVKELLADPQIQPGMMQSTLSMVTSLFTPSKVPSTGNNTPTAINEAAIGSTPSVETRDINRELSNCKDRMALELSQL